MNDELQILSREIIKTIEREDREYEFKRNKGFIERNISASKFKKSVVGLRCSDFERIISEKDESEI